MIIRTNSKRIPAPKRPLAMLMALILALSLCACSYGNAGSPGKESSAAESVAATKPSEDKESSAPDKADAGNAADNAGDAAEASQGAASASATSGQNTAAGSGSNQAAAADPAPKPILPTAMNALSDPARIDPERQYSDSTIRPGHWEKTGETFFDPTFESREEGGITITAARGDNSDWEDMIFEFKKNNKTARYTVHYDMVSDSYESGATCCPSIAIRREGGKNAPAGTIYGALYFADINDGKDPSGTNDRDAFGQKITVREYFHRKRSSVQVRTIVSRFGIGNGEGLDSSSKDDKGVEHYHFGPACSFPRLTKPGDKIWLVLDIADGGEGITGMRNVWEYTWVADPKEDSSASGKQAAAEPEEHPEDSPEWIKEVYPGHWDRTDIRYIGEGKETGQDGDVLVKSCRLGVDGQEIVYSFAETGSGSGNDGLQPVRIHIPEEAFDRRCYAGDNIINELEIFASADDEASGTGLTGDPAGYVICSLALADVEYDTGKYGVKVTPNTWFHTTWPEKDIKTFGPFPKNDTMHWRNDLGRAYLMVEGSFPEGEKDGDKLYLVWGVMDSEDGTNRLYNIYEYTWTAGPDVVWTYNPPMY